MTGPPTIVQVYVKGTPRPQPRPRMVNGTVVSTASKPAKAYRAVVLAACKSVYAQCGQIKGPVTLRLDLWFAHGKRQERAGQPHTLRPDGDNVLKLWQDCAQKAGLIEDDSRVSVTSTRKRWSVSAGGLMVIKAYTHSEADDGDNDLGVCEGGRPQEGLPCFLRPGA